MLSVVFCFFSLKAQKVKNYSFPRTELGYKFQKLKALKNGNYIMLESNRSSKGEKFIFTILSRGFEAIKKSSVINGTHINSSNTKDYRNWDESFGKINQFEIFEGKIYFFYVAFYGESNLLNCRVFDINDLKEVKKLKIGEGLSVKNHPFLFFDKNESTLGVLFEKNIKGRVSEMFYQINSDSEIIAKGVESCDHFDDNRTLNKYLYTREGVFHKAIRKRVGKTKSGIQLVKLFLRNITKNKDLGIEPKEGMINFEIWEHDQKDELIICGPKKEYKTYSNNQGTYSRYENRGIYLGTVDYDLNNIKLNLVKESEVFVLSVKSIYSPNKTESYLVNDNYGEISLIKISNNKVQWKKKLVLPMWSWGGNTLHTFNGGETGFKTDFQGDMLFVMHNRMEMKKPKRRRLKTDKTEFVLDEISLIDGGLIKRKYLLNEFDKISDFVAPSEVFRFSDTEVVVPRIGGVKSKRNGVVRVKI